MLFLKICLLYVRIHIYMTYDELWWYIHIHVLQAAETNQSGKSWKKVMPFDLTCVICFPQLCVGHPQLSCKSLECQDVCIYMYYTYIFNLHMYIYIYKCIYISICSTVTHYQIRNSNVRMYELGITNTVSDVVGRVTTEHMPLQDLIFHMLTGRCHRT